MRVLHTTDLKHPFVMWNTPHINLNFRDGVWQVIYDLKYLEGNEDLREIFERLGFVKMKDFESLMYATSDLSEALTKIKQLLDEIEDVLPTRYIVCTGISKEETKRLARDLEKVMGT